MLHRRGGNTPPCGHPLSTNPALYPPNWLIIRLSDCHNPHYQGSIKSKLSHSLIYGSKSDLVKDSFQTKTAKSVHCSQYFSPSYVSLGVELYLLICLTCRFLCSGLNFKTLSRIYLSHNLIGLYELASQNTSNKTKKNRYHKLFKI